VTREDLSGKIEGEKAGRRGAEKAWKRDWGDKRNAKREYGLVVW
jgi:hypothetical protein